MYCKNCGHELPDGVELCPKCNIQEDTDSKIKESKLPLYLSIAACIILILSTFLPFVSITFFGTKADIALIKGDGILFIGIAIITLLISFIKKHIGVIVMGILTVALSIFEAYNISHKKLDNESDFGFSIDYSALMHKEIGFYLMFLGSILILAAGIYGLLLKKGLLPIKK